MDGTLDRISNLPDDVFTHILSFVSAKEGVQTCVLSKRWRTVWASVPVLKFSSEYFWQHVPDDDIDDASWKFDRFVNSMFVNRGQSCLDTLMYEANFESSSVVSSMEWLHQAALLSPKVIDVYISGPDGLKFPNSVFSCASLRMLKLSIFTDMCYTTIKPKSITLPYLKTLKLNLLTLDDDFVRNLFLGCPSLENLNLEDCHLDISKISSNVLKKLTNGNACNLRVWKFVALALFLCEHGLSSKCRHQLTWD